MVFPYDQIVNFLVSSVRIHSDKLTSVIASAAVAILFDEMLAELSLEEETTIKALPLPV